MQLKAGSPKTDANALFALAAPNRGCLLSAQLRLMTNFRTITVIVSTVAQLVIGLRAQAGPDAFIPPRFKEIVLYAPVPDYPMAARSHYTTDAQGVYRLTVNQQSGAVEQVGVLKYAGHPHLDSAMITTFFKWRFKPGTIKQLDVPVVFERDVRVELKNAAAK